MDIKDIDLLTASLDTLDDYRGLPSEIAQAYIIRDNNIEDRISIVLEDENWSLFANDNSGDFKDIISNIHTLIAEEKDLNFLEMMTNPKYVKASPLSDRLRRIIEGYKKLIKSDQSDLEYPHVKGQDQFLYNGKRYLKYKYIRLLDSELRDALNDYYDFRSLYLNYLCYINYIYFEKNGLKEYPVEEVESNDKKYSLVCLVDGKEYYVEPYTLKLSEEKIYFDSLSDIDYLTSFSGKSSFKSNTEVYNDDKALETFKKDIENSSFIDFYIVGEDGEMLDAVMNNPDLAELTNAFDSYDEENQEEVIARLVEDIPKYVQGFGSSLPNKELSSDNKDSEYNTEDYLKYDIEDDLYPSEIVELKYKIMEYLDIIQLMSEELDINSISSSI